MATQATTRAAPAIEYAPRLPQSVRADVERVVDWLADRSVARHLAISRIRVARWRSAEVPQNREVVVDVWVDGREDDALDLWTEAGDFLTTLPGAAAGQTGAPLSIDIHW